MKKQIRILDFLEKWPSSLLPLLVLLAIPFTIYNQPPATTSTASEPEYHASLRLSPSRATLTPGEVFEVSILLDTGQSKVDGADAVLKYNPRMLELLSLERGTLFEEYISEEADRENGEITLAGVTFSPRKKNGTLGHLAFRALKKGSTTVFFEFLPGATKDSNVALAGAGGVDILKEVVNAQYAIE